MRLNDNYYQKTFYLAQVDNNDQILGKIERWEAHKKGILHRGLTAILIFNDQIILQKRRHPVFDSYWDISFSSHPIFINGKIQDSKEAVLMTLKREWITKEEIKKNQIIYLDKFYYQAKDEKSGLIEHEIDYLFLINLKSIPEFNSQYAYEITMIEKNSLKNKKVFKDILKGKKLAPWVKIDHYQRLLT